MNLKRVPLTNEIAKYLKFMSLELWKKQRTEKIFKIMEETFTNMTKEENIQHQEEEKTPSKINPEKATQRYVTVNPVKIWISGKADIRKRQNSQKQSYYITITVNMPNRHGDIKVFMPIKRFAKYRGKKTYTAN